MPSGVVRASVCSISGHLPTDLCREGHAGKTSVVTDYFIKGTAPTTFCDVHVEAEVNSENNKLATENTPAELRVKKVFIKRDYKPSVTLSDQEYVLPTEKDDTVPKPITPDPTTPPAGSDGGNNGNPGNDGGNNGTPGNNDGNTGTPGNSNPPGNNTTPGNP